MCLQKGRLRGRADRDSPADRSSSRCSPRHRGLCHQKFLGNIQRHLISSLHCEWHSEFWPLKAGPWREICWGPSALWGAALLQSCYWAARCLCSQVWHCLSLSNKYCKKVINKDVVLNSNYVWNNRKVIAIAITGKAWALNGVNICLGGFILTVDRTSILAAFFPCQLSGWRSSILNLTKCSTFLSSLN